jgi:1-acyl-sn-glycerol-3-phosphate acyltransferase
MNIPFWTGWSSFRLFTTLVCRCKSYGTENIPKSGGFIIATNHISYYDPPLAGSRIKREQFFFAKKELFKNPLVRSILLAVNARPVKRGVIDRGAIDTAVQAIKDGYALTVFPEGTRSRTGDFLDPKPGIGLIAHQAGCPILPGFIQGFDRIKDCIAGRAKMLTIYGEPIPADWVKSLPAEKESYLKIAETVMDRIRALRKDIRNR